MPIPRHLKDLHEKIGSGILQIASATVIIRDDSGEILLVISAENQMWVLPTGTIDLGESPA